MFGQFQGPGWGRLGAESGQAGVPRPQKGLGTRPRDSPLRRVRAQMVGEAGRDFQEYCSLLVNTPHPLSPALESEQHGSAEVPGTGSGAMQTPSHLLET